MTNKQRAREMFDTVYGTGVRVEDLEAYFLLNLNEAKKQSDLDELLQAEPECRSCDGAGILPDIADEECWACDGLGRRVHCSHALRILAEIKRRSR